MRIRVPRRILLLGCALALLCALPAVTPSLSDARPYNWDSDPLDSDSPTPPAKGDGDGTVVKVRYIGESSAEASSVTTTTTTTVTSQRTWSLWRTYLSLVRWSFGIRWGGY
jgi:hypothetical protein